MLSGIGPQSALSKRSVACASTPASRAPDRRGPATLNILRQRRRPVLVLTAVLPAAVLLAGAASIGATQGQDERINKYLVDITIGQSGQLRITETIQYDFGAAQRHGIFRNIPNRFPYDGKFDRIYPLEVLAVTGSAGTPSGYEVEDVEGHKRLRIGDPDRTISGRHTYIITYTVEGAFNGFPGHDEAYWNAVGAEWGVPIGEAIATVTAPGPITRVTCFSGPHLSTLPCPEAAADGPTARFKASNLPPRQGLTVVVALPKGIVPGPAPILEERWSLSRAFDTSRPMVLGTIGLSVAVLLGSGGLWKAGRDRRAEASPADAALASVGGEPSMEMQPPGGLLPGQVGTLIDEAANPLDVTATIVHLAVRGYLEIDEIPTEGFFSRQDWELRKIEDKDVEELRPYERLLIEKIFDEGSPVRVSDLRNNFSSQLKRVQDALYEDALTQGWFVARPDRVRRRWTTIGAMAVIVSISAMAALVAFTRFALLGVPLVAAASLLLIGARWMPHRTAKGAAAVRRVQGFRRFIEESEKERAVFAENQNWFSEYLPYAIVFGATDKWAKAFEGLDDEVASYSTWYGGSQPFRTSTFCSSMGDFAVTTSGTLASTPAGSGSSGFSGAGGHSGGGGGGGGGGSW